MYTGVSGFYPSAPLPLSSATPGKKTGHDTTVTAEIKASVQPRRKALPAFVHRGEWLGAAISDKRSPVPVLQQISPDNRQAIGTYQRVSAPLLSPGVLLERFA